MTDDMEILVESLLLESEDVLKQNGVAFASGHFGNLHDFAGAVRKTRLLDNQVNCGGDLFADCGGGQFKTGHHHHVFETRQRVARIVCVAGGHGAVMSGVHCLEHIERFCAAAFSDDDAVRAHAERVDD